MISRPVKETDKEGVLIVTIKNKQTGLEHNGTVCDDALTWHTARIFCRNIGYYFSDWGSYPRNVKYIPGLVSKFYVILTFVSTYSTLYNRYNFLLILL